MEGVGDMTIVPFIRTAHVDDSQWLALRPALIQCLDINAGKLARRQCCSFPGLNTAIDIAIDSLVADTDQLHNGLATPLLVFDQQHQWGIERKNPADVGAKRAIKFDINGTRNMLVCKGFAVAAVDKWHSPSYMCLYHRRRECRRRWQGSEDTRAILVSIVHVLVVRRIGNIARDLLLHELGLVLCQCCRIGKTLLGNRGGTNRSDAA